MNGLYDDFEDINSMEDLNELNEFDPVLCKALQYVAWAEHLLRLVHKPTEEEFNRAVEYWFGRGEDLFIYEPDNDWLNTTPN